VTPDDVGRIDAILANWPYDDVAVAVVTDGERILGLGDLGASGMGISIGKVSLYVAGAGIHPARTLPVCLDVGTDNESIRTDPLYLGLRRPRLRGPEYDRLVEAFFAGMARRFPGALIQFEDFAKTNSFRLLDRFRNRARCFNDDIQGTAAVTYAGVLAGLRIKHEPLDQQRVFIVGGGSAGIGVARLLTSAQVWMFDSKGLCTRQRANVAEEARPFARDEADGQLLEVARRVRPTVLIGVSGQPGLFTEELLRTMAGPRPLIFPLSNPTSKSECTPDQARAWTGGGAIVATGSPFPHTAQCNNVYIFPGVGLAATATGATRITDGMFRAAAARLAAMAAATGGEALYPPLADIRNISVEVAVAVGLQAMAEGVAPALDERTTRERIAAEVWEPRYVRYVPPQR
jgi:malic enzyme